MSTVTQTATGGLVGGSTSSGFTQPLGNVGATSTQGASGLSPGPKPSVFMPKNIITQSAPQVKKVVNVQYQRYLDKMSEALNKNIEKNIFPHWRNHQSMKGKLI